jgi:outer membrane protein
VRVLRGLAAAALIGFGPFLTTSTAYAANLLNIYERARQEDAQFQAARADFRSAREATPQARSAILPQVTFTYSRADVERETTTGNQPSSTIDIDEESHVIELRQTLFSWSEFAGVDRAQAQVAQAEAQFAVAEQDLIIRAAQAYFDVLIARDELRFARAEKRAIERQLEQAKQRFEVGVIPITDVKEAQASFDLAVSREIEAENALEDAREALRTVIGRQPSRLAGTRDQLSLAPPEPAIPKPWVQRAVERNPEVLAARSAIQASRHNMRIARSGRYPEVDLVVSRSNRESAFTSFGQPQDTEDTSASIGVELTWNIFSGGAISSRQEQARADFQATQSRLVQARRSVTQRTRNAFRAVESSISQVEALRQAVESNQAAVEAARAGFEAGTRTAVDVLDALSNLFSAQSNLASARYNYILNRLQLKRAVGTLTIEDVRLVNSWLTSPDS